jgi:hypothetical protein
MLVFGLDHNERRVGMITLPCISYDAIVEAARDFETVFYRSDVAGAVHQFNTTSPMVQLLRYRTAFSFSSFA